MKLRLGSWLSLVVAGLVAASCSDLEAPAGVAAEDGGVPEASSPDAPVVPGNDAEVDASDAAADAADAADADGGVVYAGNHVWSKLLGEPNGIEMGEQHLAPGPSGGVFVTGSFSGTIDFGNGAALTGPNTGGVNPNAPNCYLARLDKDGKHVWSKSFIPTGSGAGVACSTVLADASGVYMSGAFGGTVDFGGGPLTGGVSGSFIAKFDLSGAHLWSKQYDVRNYRLALVGSDVALVGRSAASPDFGGGALTGTGNRTYLARLSGANGAHVWSKQSVGSFLAHAITADGAGNIIAAGELNDSIDWGGGTETSAGVNDVYVVKLDGNGSVTWTKRVGTDRRETARAIATNAANEIFVTGYTSGTLDFGSGPITATNPTAPANGTAYLAKLSPAGAGVWSKIYSTNGPTVEAAGFGLAVDPAGNVVVTGFAYCGLDFGGGALPATDGVANVFIAKLDPAGSRLWSKGWASGTQNGNGFGSGRSVAIDTDGNTLVAAGLRGSTIDMGGGPLTASPGNKTDHLVAKFGP